MKRIILLAVLVIGSSNNAFAQNNWDELTQAQQRILLPFEPDWQNMDAKTKNQLMKNTEKWLNMSPEQKKIARKKLKRYKKRTLQEQKYLKRNAKWFNKLSDQEKQRLIKRYRQFKNMHPEKRQRIRQRFKNKTPKQKKQMLRKMQKRDFLKQFDKELRPDIVAMIKHIEKPYKTPLFRHLKTLSAEDRQNFVIQLLEMSIDERMDFVKSSTNK